ncbi:hypothetical protein Tco_0320148 [Tanacetum coccineum]
MSIQDMKDLRQHYLDEMLSLSNDLQIKDYHNEKIDIHFRRECESMIDELIGKFNGMSIEINKKKELQRLDQVANLSTYPLQRFKSFFYDEDAQEKIFKIIEPLFEFDDKYISSDVNPLFNEVLEDIESKDSYVSNLDEPALLVVPLSDANEDECLTQETVLMRSMLFLDIDVSTDIKDGYHDFEEVASEDVVNRKSSSCSVICYTSSHSPCILQQLCLQGVLTPVRGESSEILNGFDVSLLVAIISGVVSLCPSEGVCLVNETHFYSHYLNIGLVNPLAPREKCQPSNIGFAIRLLPKAIIL